MPRADVQRMTLEDMAREHDTIDAWNDMQEYRRQNLIPKEGK